MGVLRVICAPLTDCLNFTRLSGSGWGLTGDDLLVISRGVFLGILLYAVPAWWPVPSPRSGLEKKLDSAQKAVLLKVVRAFRTTSGVAVTVLAGVLPVRLEAARRHAGYCIAKGLPFAAGGLRVDEAGAAALTRPELTGGPAGWSLGLVEYPLSPQGDGEETAEHILLDAQGCLKEDQTGGCHLPSGGHRGLD
ncbi:unnamed protein product [Nesidiocoris tenuis]|uniref:Uncharacterized protein n=1 Tax=Nesidiocoris tenuis TaxID=355587 RepID=A0A6H5GSI7_9HEMI|nr:unnamed protein product [Nesidiocoris tenuis]